MHPNATLELGVEVPDTMNNTDEIGDGHPDTPIHLSSWRIIIEESSIQIFEGEDFTTGNDSFIVL